MVKIAPVSAAIIIGAVSTSAFVPTNSPTFVNKQISTSTQLEAAPTMVIYWSIKTAFDTLMYAAGQTDEVKGTGVWNAFELKRDKEEKEESPDSGKKDEGK